MVQNTTNSSPKIGQIVPEKLSAIDSVRTPMEFLDEKSPTIVNNINNKPSSIPQKAQPLASLYIPPAHEVFANSKQSLLNQSSPPWMSSKLESKETPEWVNKDEENDVIEDTPEILKNVSRIEIEQPIIQSPVTPIRAQLVSPQIVQVNPTMQSPNIQEVYPQSPSLLTERSVTTPSLLADKSSTTPTLLPSHNLPQKQMIVHPSPIYNRVPLSAMQQTMGMENQSQTKVNVD